MSEQRNQKICCQWSAVEQKKKNQARCYKHFFKACKEKKLHRRWNINMENSSLKETFNTPRKLKKTKQTKRRRSSCRDTDQSTTESELPYIKGSQFYRVVHSPTLYVKSPSWSHQKNRDFRALWLPPLLWAIRLDYLTPLQKHLPLTEHSPSSIMFRVKMWE